MVVTNPGPEPGEPGIDQRQLKYKRKVARIRKLIKSMVFENAALCDQVAQMQETILGVKEERKFLLRKLIEFDADIHIEAKPSGSGSQPPRDAAAEQLAPKAPAIATAAVAGVARTRKPYKKRAVPPEKATGQKKPKKLYKKKKVSKVQQPADPPQSLIAAEELQALGEQRLAADMDAQQELDELQQQQQQHQLHLDQLEQQMCEDVHTIAVDELGRPIYPVELGPNLAVFDFGEIAPMRPNFHTEHWLYPVGYVATRIYGHMNEPRRRCVYTCKITDGGDYPIFEIIPESDMNFAIAGPTPDLCHAALLQTMNSNSTGGPAVEVRPTGEWFFGLGHPTVVALLLQQSNVEQCGNFAGFLPGTLTSEQPDNETCNYEALLRYVGAAGGGRAAAARGGQRSVYHHAVPEVRDEPPDQLLQIMG